MEREILEEDFRAIGFSGAAAQFPRDELAVHMLAAFNNVDVSKISEPMKYFPNEATKVAWTRVAEAAYRYIATNENSNA